MTPTKWKLGGLAAVTVAAAALGLAAVPAPTADGQAAPPKVASLLYELTRAKP